MGKIRFRHVTYHVMCHVVRPLQIRLNPLKGLFELGQKLVSSERLERAGWRKDCFRGVTMGFRVRGSSRCFL